MDQSTSIDPRLFGASPALRGSEPAARTDAAKVRDVAMQFESMLLAQMLKELQTAMSGEGDDDKDNQLQSGAAVRRDVDPAEPDAEPRRRHGPGRLALARTRPADDAAKRAVEPPSATFVLTRLPEGFAMPAGGRTEPARASSCQPSSPSATDPRARCLCRRCRPRGSVRRSACATIRSMVSRGFTMAWMSPMVKGREVRAAADGMVTAVSDRSGYGLTVVVAHENGVETRYAHLSAADVRPGDVVSRGGVIARAGNSGRSTGPHLHFEVREGGQSVDPARVARRGRGCARQSITCGHCAWGPPVPIDLMIAKRDPASRARFEKRTLKNRVSWSITSM